MAHQLIEEQTTSQPANRTTARPTLWCNFFCTSLTLFLRFILTKLYKLSNEQSVNCYSKGKAVSDHQKIANFPNFSQLSINHRREIEEFTARFEPYSDFNFTSLFCWNTNGQTEVSILNNNLVIKIPDYLSSKPVYSLMGDSLIDQSIRELLEPVKELRLVPENVVEKIGKKTDFSITEDRDNFDYLYSLTDLSKLAGSKFKKKRNKSNSFIKAHQDYELDVNTHRSIGTDLAKKLGQVDRLWADQASRSQGDILSERKAIDALISHSTEFDLLIVEISVDKAIKAFSINEKIGGDYAICHFEKALKVHHQNIYTFLASQTAAEIKKLGCEFVNWEQDLGLEGLRKSKMSYHPVRMLKKYTLSLAG